LLIRSSGRAKIAGGGTILDAQMLGDLDLQNY
jgi:hypothetical protein